MQQVSDPPTTRDPEPEPATVEDAVMTAMVRVGKQLRQRLPGDQLDFTSIPLLKTVEHHGPLRVSVLADLLHLDASTVSRHVSGLEERGLLERTVDPDDGRASQVALRELGATCVEEAAARRRALLADLLADWDAADRETLRHLLNRLSRTLELQEQA